MPTKIFTTITGKCPFGRGCDIDSQGCRDCKDYFRAGTGMFFWCNYQTPVTTSAESPKPAKVTKSVSEKRKRGRPPGKARKTAVNQRKSKKL